MPGFEQRRLVSCPHVLTDLTRPRRLAPTPDRGNAGDNHGTDHHDRDAALLSFKKADKPLIAGQQAVHSLHRSGVDRKEITGHIAGFH